MDYMGFLENISAKQMLGLDHSWELLDVTIDTDSFSQILPM